MKAIELMIGDWVRLKPNIYYSPDENNRNAVVCGINDTSICLRFNNGFDCEYNEEDIEPILLTPEILEKNGFKYYSKYERNCGEGYYYDKNYKNDKLENLLYGDGDTWGCIWGRRLYDEYICCDINIHCVSELQHLLRILEVEDLVNNFKI